MTKSIKIIFFLVVVAGIVIYFWGQAPETFQIFRGGPKENISTPAPAAVSVSKPPAPSPPAISTGPPKIPDSQIPSGYSREQLSPYFQKVRISSAYAAQIGLYSSEEKVNITGWKIKSNKEEFNIPQAVDIYEPSGLAPEKDIIVSGNSSVSIYSGKSPISRNLRMNKCIGYLGNTYDFNPGLPQNCPSPSVPRSEITYLSGKCQSYIFSLGSCKLPDISFYNSLPGNDEGNACRAFLSTITWNSCFRKHYRDADFLSNEWRIWLNWTSPNDILDSQHDRVRLFDTQGLLIDQYIY